MSGEMIFKASERTKSAPEVVRDGLRESIVSGQYDPGQQLRQDELAEQYGTSRIPVREALRQLETEGLVTISPNKGAVVKGFSLDDIVEMFDIRIALECRALKLAVPNFAIEDVEMARQILEEYDASPEPTNWGEMNWRFHWTLYAPCDRPRLLSMIEANYGHVNRFIRTQVSMASGKARPQKEHLEILDLCQKGDVASAAALLESHIEQTQRSLQAAHRQYGRLKK
ncbi:MULTISPECIES: GntR family transcriptional regulator [Rhizobium/Agrobacterium group]|uniref:Transcriptional regulator GntR family n=2 Tax=Rhizobium/Agrobacterium group TaxID=227290 RepID=B9K3S4_ALLAM|nr:MULTISPECIES: GntR family transcriptional regulator [Rhizobium/Agrobacterium group]ACM39522.1 transcriptional regulator GntR family [Allorhizobium ampelinum S4]